MLFQVKGLLLLCTKHGWLCARDAVHQALLACILWSLPLMAWAVSGNVSMPPLLVGAPWPCAATCCEGSSLCPPEIPGTLLRHSQLCSEVVEASANLEATLSSKDWVQGVGYKAVIVCLCPVTLPCVCAGARKKGHQGLCIVHSPIRHVSSNRSVLSTCCTHLPGSRDTKVMHLGTQSQGIIMSPARPVV